MECVEMWGQCGGIDYTGPSCCADLIQWDGQVIEGECVVDNEWWSSCKPKQTSTTTTHAPSTTASTTTTQSPTTSQAFSTTTTQSPTTSQASSTGSQLRGSRALEEVESDSFISKNQNFLASKSQNFLA